MSYIGSQHIGFRQYLSVISPKCAVSPIYFIAEISNVYEKWWSCAKKHNLRCAWIGLKWISRISESVSWFQFLFEWMNHALNDNIGRVLFIKFLFQCAWARFHAHSGWHECTCTYALMSTRALMLSGTHAHSRLSTLAFCFHEYTCTHAVMSARAKLSWVHAQTQTVMSTRTLRLSWVHPHSDCHEYTRTQTIMSTRALSLSWVHAH